jgi:hypothetical protein
MATGHVAPAHDLTDAVYDAHAHDSQEEHDGFDGHVAENPRWVLIPLLVGLVVGIILIVIFGLGVDASAFGHL